MERARLGHVSFLERPLPGAELRGLDLDWIRSRYLPAAIQERVLDANERPLELQLASLRLATYDPAPAPTALGVLLAGEAPTRLLPHAYVQLVRFDGVDRAAPILDQQRFDGPLAQLVSGCETVIEAAIRVPTRLDGDLEVREPEYPFVALRELFRNAVLHRDYEAPGPVHVRWFRDRVEIASPGGPVPPLTPETLGSAEITAYRNGGLAEVTRNLRFVQRFGVGLAIARRELADNGNPPLELRADLGQVVAAVRGRGG